MAAKIISEVPRVSSEYPERNLVWSLRPIFLVMRIFGTDLDVIRRRTVYRRCAFLVLAVFILSFISYFHWEFTYPKLMTPLNQSTGVNNQLEYILYNTSHIFFYIALMVAQLVTVQLNWGNLWKKMQEMDQRGCLKPDHYNRIRKFVVILMMGAILLNVSKPMAAVVSLTSKPRSLHDIFTNPKVYQEIFQDLLMVLFLCLTYLATITNETIIQDVSTRSFQWRNVSLYWIRQWKKNYFAVQEYVKEIDRFFGPTLIITFAKISVDIIVTCSVVVNWIFQIEARNPLLFILKTITNILLAAGSIIAAQKMEEKASDLTKELKKCDFTDGDLELEVEFLMNEIHRNMPKISPMGMFHLSPELIPTLIGTTITYVLVLAQYQ